MAFSYLGVLHLNNSVDVSHNSCYNKASNEGRTNMINIRTIRKLQENDGLTLKAGRIITYKTGWQVADYGCELRTAEEAIICVRRMGGNCGIWYSEGIYYIDHSFRVKTKHEALAIGRRHAQISIWGWKAKKLAYC